MQLAPFYLNINSNNLTSDCPQPWLKPKRDSIQRVSPPPPSAWSAIPQLIKLNLLITEILNTASNGYGKALSFLQKLLPRILQPATRKQLKEEWKGRRHFRNKIVLVETVGKSQKILKGRLNEAGTGLAIIAAISAPVHGTRLTWLTRKWTELSMRSAACKHASWRMRYLDAYRGPSSRESPFNSPRGNRLHF